MGLWGDGWIAMFQPLSQPMSSFGRSDEKAGVVRRFPLSLHPSAGRRWREATDEGCISA